MSKMLDWGVYRAVLDRVIRDGIIGAQRDYANDEMKRSGAIAGFEVCQLMAPVSLERILQEAKDASFTAFANHPPDYWRVRCYEAEVEWVCNCMSVFLLLHGFGVMVQPTVRALMTIDGILKELRTVEQHAETCARLLNAMPPVDRGRKFDLAIDGQS